MATTKEDTRSQLARSGRIVRQGTIAHTLTACCRCRQRKTRCDVNLPRCGPCERSSAYCEYFDAAKGRNMPRSYVIRLQERIQELERGTAALEDSHQTDHDPEILIREAGLVRIQENEEPSYLGPSSGINMTRLVIELAKGIRKIRKIKDLIPEQQARRIRENFETEARKPTSKDYPEISSVAAPSLPSIDLTNMLVEGFFKRGQYLYPLLHEPSFRQLVVNVYNGSSNPYENFALRLVLALSMQKLSSQWTGLADSYYLAALPFLEDTAKCRNLGTLQCFMLIAQYSIVTPTRTAANWIVALAVKLCQELGLTEENTICLDRLGNPLDELEVDMRRRCYWICLAMEHGLAHSMGRPNAFGTSHDQMDVSWFRMIDDEFITAQGVSKGPVSVKKQIARHFISMRLLQLEIRRTLYLKRRPSPLSDKDPWFMQMEQKLEDWLASAPKDSDGTPYDTEWFTARHNTIVVFLFRPSPQIPKPSINAARKAFDASRVNIETQRKQIDGRGIDLSWVFCQSLFMAINAVLWALSYSEIRREHDRHTVLQLVDKALETAYYCSLKWPGVEGAIELYGTLSHTILKAYDGEADRSYDVGSPINRLSPSATGSPEPTSSPFSTDSYNQHVTASSRSSSPGTRSLSSSASGLPMTPLRQTPRFDASHLNLEGGYTSRSNLNGVPSNQLYDPSIFTNPLPPAGTTGLGNLDPNSLYSPFHQPYNSVIYNHLSYSLEGSWEAPQATVGLDLQQQSELMDQLENERINGILG